MSTMPHTVPRWSAPRVSASPGVVTWVRLGVTLAICAGLVAYFVISWRWPLIWDMQVTHYVSFLIDHGWAPYRQIGDMNMPGAYLVEGWALHLFGPSDLGWRLYDFTLAAILIASMVVIARPYDWLAGLLAGGTFTLAHGAEGPRNAGQRDQVMAVALVAGFAFCFEAVRRRRPWLMLLFGLATAMAGSVKPTLALVGPLLLVATILHLRREGIGPWPYVLWALGGFALAIAIVLRFLLVHGSLVPFVGLFTAIFPHYLTLAAPTWSHLVRITLQPPILLFAVCAVVAGWLARTLAGWEKNALLLGVFFGLVNFWAQRKGFFQHRYTLTAFVLLWAPIQVLPALRARPSARLVALAGLVVITLFYIPRNVHWMRTWADRDDYSYTLTRDLASLGPERLQNSVQCLDVVDGCLDALYHLQIVQSTGSTGDLLLFQPQDAPVVDNAREGFWAAIERNPPAVFVLGNWQFGQHRSFNKVEAWPVFAQFLHTQYVPVVERSFREMNAPQSQGGAGTDDAGYRIYVRRDSPLLATARSIQQTPSAGSR